MTAPTNPFIERGRITNPAHFAGRWSELSLLFERLENGTPVLLAGVPGVGKSSLLTHVTQAAATNLDEPNLHGFYLDVTGAEDAAHVYRTLNQALEQPGSTLAALEVSLLAVGAPVVLCLDEVQTIAAQEWGQTLLESLARLARGRQLMLVAAVNGPPPEFSERFATITVGAFAAPEIRLLVDAYLDGTGITFSPVELRALAVLSAAHPAYLQRAAYHLFQSKLYPGLHWRSAYLAEAREHPIPGAPLPPAVFQGEQDARMDDSTYTDETQPGHAARPPNLPELELNTGLFAILPLLAGALAYLVVGSLWLALAIAVLGLALVALFDRRARADAGRKNEEGNMKIEDRR